MKYVIINLSEDKNVDNICFEIFSKDLSLSELRSWISKIEYDYKIIKKNSLGTNRYFFNEIPVQPIVDNDGKYRLETAPKKLIFGMTKFTTNKSLDNIYGPDIEIIRAKNI